MIKIEGLTKIYRTDEVESTVLDHLNLTVEKGEFLSIMGPSGCGKSTLLNILGMLDSPTSGLYFFDGEEVSGFSEKKRTIKRKGQIGFIFQSFNLIDELTVYENIELPLIYLKVGKKERRERVEKMMKTFSIANRRNHFPQQLSGGQQQRVAVARAIITRPNIILADEPTGNLDSRRGKTVMNYLVRLHKAGATIIMVTHSRQYAEYADRRIRLFDGKIISESVKEALNV
ncbi:ABC transporter ATP-binding protein [Spirochaeta isovalerica]|uniref:Putative ABC transport system ATP-binding protein n=1 Tax=Spirochaeta isovalerica TaxID=150 RepID=A0A841R915_9SPIO|nr:ABC transporter ATP-binding protein [Spirochaeta isovalerica]MBB6479667.1 putative ABC transport system ATP-binding protein [Spirochaeta isovalerica]